VEQSLAVVALHVEQLRVEVELVGGRADGQQRGVLYAEQRHAHGMEHGLVHERGLLEDDHIRGCASETCIRYKQHV
jgi:hypothetical protein